MNSARPAITCESVWRQGKSESANCSNALMASQALTPRTFSWLRLPFASGVRPGTFATSSGVTPSALTIKPAPPDGANVTFKVFFFVAFGRPIQSPHYVSLSVGLVEVRVLWDRTLRSNGATAMSNANIFKYLHTEI